ncbi:hypothetical protein [Rhizobium leguminosarum]|uniref:hypothetical protein n=1 Tax=Rhizobium leguminosarum TaxID=384 RepID=UPI001C95E43D|nr:hypothetical protein [Rhizobium leguminosarum]MBY5579637.1 hypothetical protein [Rhizobium leguminosarum]
MAQLKHSTQSGAQGTAILDHLDIARSFATMIDANLEAAERASDQSDSGNHRSERDELEDIVSQYFEGHDYLNSLPIEAVTTETEPALVEEHVEVHVKKLLSRKAAAVSKRSALAALRIVHHDMDGFAGNPLSAAMFAVAMAFYEAEEGRNDKSTTGANQPLLALIDAHRKTHSEFLIAIDEKEAAEQAFREVFKGKLYKGPFATSYEMTYGMEWVQEQVSTEISWYREKMKMLAGMDQSAHDVALAALTLGEERHLAAIAEVFADEKAKIDLAEEHYDRLGDAECDSLLAILDYQCATIEEVRLKGEYLSSDHLRGAIFDPGYVDALIQSMKA